MYHLKLDSGVRLLCKIQSGKTYLKQHKSHSCNRRVIKAKELLQNLCEIRPTINMRHTYQDEINLLHSKPLLFISLQPRIEYNELCRLMTVSRRPLGLYLTVNYGEL